MQPNTLAILDAIEHLGEIARLFLVLGRRGLQQTEEAALLEACKRTAGLSTRYPRPKAALAFAIRFGLLSSKQGVVRLTERGRLFFSKGEKLSLNLSVEQSKLLLGSLLDDLLVEEKVKTLFNHFQLIKGELAARKNGLLASQDLHLFCRVLQQIGVLKSVGDYFVLAKSFDPIVESLIICSARLSQQELLNRLERQRKRGELAEEFVLKLERKRLLTHGCPALAARVERVSIQDSGAGYDIKSFEKNGNLRFVEVKSSVGGQIIFEWSEGERLTAKREQGAYYVYFVPFSFAVPNLDIPVVLIKNPIARIEQGMLVEFSSSYKVAETKEAYEMQSHKKPTRFKATPSGFVDFLV